MDRCTGATTRLGCKESLDQDSGLGTALITELFDDKVMAVPPALYTFGCMLTGTVLAQLWRRQAV